MRPLVRKSINKKAGKLFPKDFYEVLHGVYGAGVDYRDLTNRLIYQTLRQGTVQQLFAVVPRNASGKAIHPKHKYLTWEGRRWVTRRVRYIMKLAEQKLDAKKFEALYFKRFGSKITVVEAPTSKLDSYFSWAVKQGVEFLTSVTFKNTVRKLQHA